MYRTFLFTTLLATTLLAKNTLSEPLQLDISRAVRRHQQYRQAIKSSNMIKAVWSPELATKAAALLSTCPVDAERLEEQMKNSTDAMNIGFSSFVSPSRIRGPEDVQLGIIDIWGSQRANFQYSRGCGDGSCKEYIRMISAGMYQLGCAMAKCADESILVCLYKDRTTVDPKRPYKVGNACSECPADFPICENRMCAAAPLGSQSGGEPDVVPPKPEIRPAPSPSPQPSSQVQPRTTPPPSPETMEETGEEVKDAVLISADAEPTTTSKSSKNIFGFLNGFTLLISTVLLHYGYSN